MTAPTLVRELEAPARVIEAGALADLVDELRGRGYRVIGPTVRDGAVVYEELASAGELPAGVQDRQQAAEYRLEHTESPERFAFASSPQSFKRWLFPARTLLFRARTDAAAGLAVEEGPLPDRPYAFLGVRSCDLHAIAVQDRVFLGGTFTDRDYAARRSGAFVVAVTCGHPSGTCFCASMGTGPRATGGFDLALTELVEGGHRYLAEAGTAHGLAVLDALPGRDAGPEDLDAAARVTDGAAARMGRHVEADGLRDLLARNFEHPRFAEVAGRCLTCANCTLVCPTCFCSAVDEVNVLDGSAERHRRWDSCFGLDHSYIHGGSVRRAPRARYRQWLTHKFGTWVDQFGTSGCVGCGRCITWCPVGIDVTEELAAIRATDGEVDRAHA